MLNWMRSASKVLAVATLGLLVLGFMPGATDEPAALSKRPKWGTYVVLDIFPGPPTFGIYLLYVSAHPYAWHCPYGYVLRVANEDSYDLRGLWDLWRWFGNPSTPPPGVEIEWEGFPNPLWLGHGIGYDVPEEPFQGFATEGLFESSGSEDSWLILEFGPAGDSASMAMDLVRAEAGPPDPFIVQTFGCM